MAIRLITYHKASLIPHLPGCRFEHSSELFSVYEQTPGYRPVMIVAYDAERVIAKLLAVVRKSTRHFPPSIIKRCEIYGCGEYFTPPINKEQLFGEILEYLTNEVLKDAFLIEFRNLEKPLFAYRYFRGCHYFPIKWMRIYNSLHSRNPKESLEPTHKRRIEKGIKNGAVIKTNPTVEEQDAFLKMLKYAYSTKPGKHFPDINYFRQLIRLNSKKETARIFIVKHNEKIIGGTFCIYSGNNAYLWFTGSLNKTYPRLHPEVLSIWAAISHAYENNYRHFEFMNSGLPFSKFGYRDFILGFGGRQISTRRWYRFRWKWLNYIACRLYR